MNLTAMAPNETMNRNMSIIEFFFQLFLQHLSAYGSMEIRDRVWLHLNDLLYSFWQIFMVQLFTRVALVALKWL